VQANHSPISDQEISNILGPDMTTRGRLLLELAVERITAATFVHHGNKSTFDAVAMQEVRRLLRPDPSPAASPAR
jgi:streptomycin 6-kinase